MTEAEDFKTGRESRADVVVYRAARSAGYTDVVQRLVDVAVYRETHHVRPGIVNSGQSVGDTHAELG